jgi:hypothetical protein
MPSRELNDNDFQYDKEIPKVRTCCLPRRLSIFRQLLETPIAESEPFTGRIPAANSVAQVRRSKPEQCLQSNKDPQENSADRQNKFVITVDNSPALRAMLRSLAGPQLQLNAF